MVGDFKPFSQYPIDEGGTVKQTVDISAISFAART
jgi:hypothetical protein